MNKRLIGEYGERLATMWLLENQFEIVTQNYFCPYGEIDLIVRKDNVYYFVEVKYRRSLKYGSSKESITKAKMNHIKKAALHYIRSKDYFVNYKLSFLGIHDIQGKVEMIWIENLLE